MKEDYTRDVGKTETWNEGYVEDIGIRATGKAENTWKN